MKSVIMRITFFTILLFSLVISSAYSATERRTALVIGNGNYADGRLKNPVYDATDMAATLKSLGFIVTLKTDADLREMKEEIDNFGDSLKRGGVGLFFYAGHGLQVGGTNYLIPVRAKISNERMVEHEALDVNRLLSTLDNAGNSVNIVMLDACRDNPLTRSFRNAGRGLAIISKTPPGTLISFSTGANQVAADGDGRNSPYTAALLQHIKTPGLPVEQIFKRVRNRLVENTRGKQEPAEYTTLREDFYFIPQGGSAPSPDSDELARQKEALERERQELAREKQTLERQKALDAEREQLAAERRKIEAERQQLAKMQEPSVSTVLETGRDGRFIAYSNGTVLDTKTNLMWAAMDNGSNINLNDAKNYCENYRGGGYSDWRMPTQDELVGLYDGSVNGNNGYHLTTLITLTACCPWVAGGSDAANFNFSFGIRNWHSQSWGEFFPRELPVRSVK